jgi:hypothetical protein
MRSEEVVWHGKKIESWGAFHRVVKPGRKLLARLERFPDAVLVAGCQRSGTTATTRLLARAEGVGDYRFGKDDELDAALLLSGYADLPATGRACLQTTYLNDRLEEYFEHDGFRLVWLIREPRSVIYSMLFNWRRGALRRLYAACGRAEEKAQSSPWLGMDGDLFRSSFEMACAAYAAKTAQIFELARRLGSDRFLVLDYNDLVLDKERLLPMLFRFAELPFRQDFIEGLHSQALSRARWSKRQAERIEATCRPVYERARELTLGAAAVA